MAAHHQVNDTAAMKRDFSQPLHADVDAVLVGASAGGIDTLLSLLQGVAMGPRVPLVVVLHLSPDHQSRLPEIFAARLGITTRQIDAGAPVHGGTLYFAPPGSHALIEADRTFSLSGRAPVHFSRPSIDVLFESAAAAYGARVAGIVLTGANEDGAAGLRSIRQGGGLAVVQDPAGAIHATMPQAALDAADPEYVLGLDDLRLLLRALLAP